MVVPRIEGRAPHAPRPRPSYSPPKAQECVAPCRSVGEGELNISRMARNGQGTRSPPYSPHPQLGFWASPARPDTSGFFPGVEQTEGLWMRGNIRLSGAEVSC